ncbi:MAG: Hsp20/alpha crystallin family protein [Clostridiales bacterium]|jgi:HSP20 family molecular chaperone IbpA|nr:Hsp20/alpha crystallin family protein [Clostridiales bacterium]
MLMPRLISNNLFEDWMGGFPSANDFFSNQNRDIMKTDVKENEDGYLLEIDLPGFKKDDVKASLKDGYMTVSASRTTDKDEKDQEGRYIRKERYEGSCSRSFYVGENVTESDINAKFEDGILKISVPKKVPEKVEKENYIAIEG